MKGIKLEEMLVNAILDPNKKFTHKSWYKHQYMHWKDGVTAKYFVYEDDSVAEIFEICTELEGWKEYGN